MNTRGTIIGVDLGGTKVSVGAVSEDNILKTVKREVPALESEDVVLAEITDAIAEVFDETVVGIGCGVPSVVDVDQGIVFDVENIPSWRKVHLKTAFENYFGVPAVINNDANAFAVGEHVFGMGRGYRNLVGLTLGTGLGAGVIIEGRLFNGVNCGAGEIGMMNHKGLTLEDYCSGRLFPREYGLEGNVVFARAQDGDPLALAAFEHFGRELAEAVMMSLYAYDPEIVVLGGSIAHAWSFFEMGLLEGLGGFAYPHVIDRLVLTPSRLDNAAILGAAALYVDVTTP
jgi:glucokinase